MASGFVRDRMTWQFYLLMTYYAYLLNVLGPLTPFLRDELQVSYTVASFHFSAFAIGMLVIGFVVDRIVKRLGRLRASWIGAIGMGAASLLLMVGQAAWLTIGAAFLMGVIGSLLVTTMPAEMADRYGSQQAIAISEMNMLSSISGAIASLAVGFFARFWVGWRMALVLPMLALALIALVFQPWAAAVRAKAAGRAKSPEKMENAPEEYNASPSEQTTPRLSFRYWLFWLMVLAFVAIEFCMVYWGADFLEKSAGMPRADAASAISLFLGGMVLGRLGSSLLARRLNSEQLIPISLLVCLAGFMLFWLGGSPWLAVLGLAVTGVGVGPLYPLTLVMAIQAAGPAIVKASARASLASGLAILLLPLLLGRLADLLGIHTAYLVIPALLGAGFILLVISNAISRRAAQVVQPTV